MANENDYLLMCQDFKQRFEEKNNQLKDLIILIFNLYGILNVYEKYEDVSLIHVMQEMVHVEIQKYLKVDIE